MKTVVKQSDTLSQKVTFIAHLGKSELAELFSNSSFMVHPSQKETFGIVIAEAVSCGLPVAINTSSGPADFFTEQMGECAKPTEQDALFLAADRLIQRISAFDRQLMHLAIHQRYGYQAYADRLNSILASVVTDNRIMAS
jgi:glycosyltransferase involved in cell wall biosynthesis